ncbi:mitogen-activated protein kinase kinase kinase 20-like [Impatiens glandulifera]|uniref:mitogen-activated protein kinase kinase kinase 20-like n=1 Tax=Impatiens glandulifera TaxID=253017 RepID=UPI001FB0E1C0|nr:mitogen-activated protein kinase kinase kinase 20-like [Impatiens glandulifera]
MNWVRGETIGYGSFASVSLAKDVGDHLDQTLMAVKYCQASCSDSLISEKEVLKMMKGCPQIIRLYGDEISHEKGQRFYNLLIEYAAGGDLGRKIKNSRLSEMEVRRHTRSVMEGLKFIHGSGFVHCDIKPTNVLLCSAVDGGDQVAKIADFGLAKMAGERIGVNLRGTPLYMSPEMVNEGEQESPADIWALGCLISEMITGNPVWKFPGDENFCKLLLRIGTGDSSPAIPEELSDEGKDFLRKCFIRDPRDRWTAEMLLSHPFVANIENNSTEVESNGEDEVHVYRQISPRCPFDFPNRDRSCSMSSPAERLRRLGTTAAEKSNWSSCGDWVVVR